MNGVLMSRALTASVKRVASRYLGKRAGLLQPPPKMVDAITAWAEANTAATRLEDREGDSTLSESELREIARRGKGEAVPYNGEIVKMFPIDLRGWKYGDRLEKLIEYEMRESRGVMQHLDKQLQMNPALEQLDLFARMQEAARQKLKEESRSQRIRVVLKHVGSRRVGGDWSPALGIMTIFITSQSPLSAIRQTVKHELTHLAQDLLTKTSDAAVKDLHRNPFGLPSRKIRTPWYKAPYSDISEHSMDDREFYPKLADAVDEMRAALDRLPPEQHRDAFKKMVGEKRGGGSGGLRLLSVLPFFLHLSRAEEGKWGKAVSVAYGELFGGSSSRVASRYAALGQCYPWATQFAWDKDGAVIVHGTIVGLDRSARVRPLEHAWVEWKGKVYDWQTIEAMKKPPMSISAWRRKNKAREQYRLTDEEASICAVRSGHHGPWTEAEREFIASRR